MDEKYLKVLEVARSLIENGWTQGSFATDKAGLKINMNSENAVSFCLIGARNRAFRIAHSNHNGIAVADVVKNIDYYSDLSKFVESLRKVTQIVAPEINKIGLADWNDKLGRTKTEVLDYLDTVIKYVKAQHGRF